MFPRHTKRILCLFMSVFHYYAFHPARNGGEYFVRYGPEDGGKLLGGRVFAEYCHGISDFGIDTGDIEHAHIHAYIAYGGYPVPVKKERGRSAPETSVHAVSVAYGNGGDYCT